MCYLRMKEIGGACLRRLLLVLSRLGGSRTGRHRWGRADRWCVRWLAGLGSLLFLLLRRRNGDKTVCSCCRRRLLLLVLSRLGSCRTGGHRRSRADRWCVGWLAGLGSLLCLLHASLRRLQHASSCG